MLRIKIGVTTSRGNVRSSNEDNFLMNGKCLEINKDEKTLGGRGKKPLLAAVFDGMGGSSLGKEASLTAATLLSEYGRDSARSGDTLSITGLDQLLKRVNLGICAMKTSGKVPGSTVALLSINHKAVYAANVGDSRIYQYQKKRLEQLSVDHNQAHDLITFGLRTEGRSGKNVLTQYLGILPEEMVIEPHYVTLENEKKYFLLCTDGLMEGIGETEIATIIDKYKYNVKKSTQVMVSEAIRGGARDNLTAMLIRIS